MPTQITVAWRTNKWVIEQDATLFGAYAYRSHAIDQAQRLAVEAGADSHLLIQEKDGRWVARRPSSARSGRKA